MLSLIRFQSILQEKDIIHVACGDYHSLALSKGTFLEPYFLKLVSMCVKPVECSFVTGKNKILSFIWFGVLFLMELEMRIIGYIKSSGSQNCYSYILFHSCIF